MTRSQALAVTHGLTQYASGLVTADVANTVHGDVLHLTGAPVPVNSDSFEYAVFDGNASTQLADTTKSTNDPYGVELTFGGSLVTGLLNSNGGHTQWYESGNGISDAQLLNSVQSAARVASVRLLTSRLNGLFAVVDASATAPSAIDLTSGSTEAVELMQANIDNALLAAGGYGQVHLLWGPTAFRKFANHAKVQGRFTGGATKKDPATPTLEQVDALLGLNTMSRMSRAVYNSNAAGQAVNNAYLLGATCYIAVVSPVPLTNDPSGVKLFQGMGDPLTPTFYKSLNGTHEACSWSWKEVAKVTNAAALIKQAFTV